MQARIFRKQPAPAEVALQLLHWRRREPNRYARSGHRRVEVLTGPSQRRRWSAESKGQVVAESLAPGARPSEVARR